MRSAPPLWRFPFSLHFVLRGARRVDGRLVPFRPRRLRPPDGLHVGLRPRVRPEPLVDRDVHRAVVAVEVGVVQLVEVVATPGPLKPIVAEPCSDAAVDDAPHRDARVGAEEDGDQRRRVVRRRLDGVHVRARERGGVVPTM